MKKLILLLCLYCFTSLIALIFFVDHALVIKESYNAHGYFVTTLYTLFFLSVGLLCGFKAVCTALELRKEVKIGKAEREQRAKERAAAKQAREEEAKQKRIEELQNELDELKKN